MDWNSSRQRCQDLGGDLVILNSQEEQVWTLLCKMWLFTLALNPVHPSDQHVVHNYKSFLKIKRFLTDLCDLIKYIIQYNCIWVTEKLQLASSYTWLLMRLIQHFYFNVTINHYCVFVITAIHDWDPMWRKSDVTSSHYCCQRVISKVTILLLKGVTSMSNIVHSLSN